LEGCRLPGGLGPVGLPVEESLVGQVAVDDGQQLRAPDLVTVPATHPARDDAGHVAERQPLEHDGGAVEAGHPQIGDHGPRRRAGLGEPLEVLGAKGHQRLAQEQRQATARRFVHRHQVMVAAADLREPILPDIHQATVRYSVCPSRCTSSSTGAFAG
jgi:hypothetical protein